MSAIKDVEIVARIFFPEATQVLIYTSEMQTEQDNAFTELEALRATLLMPEETAVVVNLTRLDISAQIPAPLIQLTKPVRGGRGYSYICNPDGSIRWLSPHKQKGAYFLHLYNGAGWRGRFLRFIWQLAFAVGLGRWLTHGQLWLSAAAPCWFEEPLAGRSLPYHAIFTGTRGENRKAVVALGDQRDVKYFAKLPLTVAAQQLTLQEMNILKQVNADRRNGWIVPLALPYGAAIAVSNVKARQAESPLQLTDSHLQALDAAYQDYSAPQSIGDYLATHQFPARLEKIKHSSSTSLDPATVGRLQQLLTALYADLDSSDQEVPCCLAHGDFTPWNLFLTPHGLAAYDWELASLQPLAYDAFHFILQSGVLLHRLEPVVIVQQVNELATHPIVREWFEAQPSVYTLSWHLYLLHHISYYLLKYIQQEELHEQVHWQVDAWEEILRMTVPQ